MGEQQIDAVTRRLPLPTAEPLTEQLSYNVH